MASFICAETQSRVFSTETKLNVKACRIPERGEDWYPVEDVCPTLHSDALENRQHGEEDVVKICDAAVRAFPLAAAFGPVADTETPAAGERAGRRVIFYHETWSRKQH